MSNTNDQNPVLDVEHGAAAEPSAVATAAAKPASGSLPLLRASAPVSPANAAAYAAQAPAATTGSGAGAGKAGTTGDKLAPRTTSAASLSLSLHNFTKSTRAIAAEFDDGDGELDVAEVHKAFKELHSTRRRNTKLIRYMAGGCVLFALVLVAFGLVSYYTFKMAEETEVDGKTMVNKETGQPIQVASADFKVNDQGSIVQRKVNADGSEEDGAVLTTQTNTSPAKLSSALPDSYFKELRSVEFKHETGAALYLDVVARARIIKPMSALGSVVKLVTPVGTIMLDADIVSFSSDVAPLMEEAGFVVHEEETSQGRRLLGGAAVIGWFNMVADYTKAKDYLPDSRTFPTANYTVTMTKLTKCTSDNEQCYDLEDAYVEVETPLDFDAISYVDLGNGFANVTIDGVNKTVALPATSSCPEPDNAGVRNGAPIKYGVVTINDEEYRRVVQKVHVASFSGEIMTRTETLMDRFPGHSLVELAAGTKKQRFQLYNGTRFHCTIKNGSEPAGTFNVPDLEAYSEAEAPGSERRLYQRAFGAPALAARSAAEAGAEAAAALEGHGIARRRKMTTAGDSGDAASSSSSGSTNGTLASHDTEGNPVSYHSNAEVTVVYDGIVLVDGEELRRYTVTMPISILNSVGLGVLHIYDDGVMPRRIEQPQVDTIVTIDSVQELEPVPADFQLQDCPADQQFAAQPPRMVGNPTGECIEPNELWSEARMQEGMKRILRSMTSEVEEHYRRRLADRRLQYSNVSEAVHAAYARQLATDLSLEISVGLCTFSATVTVNENDILATPDFELSISCTGKIYVVTLTGTITVEYVGGDLTVAGEIQAAIGTGGGGELMQQIKPYLQSIEKLKMPIGVSVSINEPTVTGTIAASVTWTGARAELDTDKSQCKSAFNNKYYFNGQNIVFTGTLNFHAGVTVTAGVNAVLAGAEMRAVVSGDVTLVTQFTRVNKCWQTDGGAAKTGVKDAFGTTAAVTFEFGVTAGVYATMPSGAALKKVAETFENGAKAIGAAGKAAISNLENIGGSIGDIASNLASGDFSSAGEAVTSIFGGGKKFDLSKTPEGAAAVSAFMAVDELCWEMATHPSREASTLLTAAVVTLWVRFEARRGDRIGDRFRKELWLRTVKVKHKVKTGCPVQVLNTFEKRSSRTFDKARRDVFKNVEWLQENGPYPRNKGNTKYAVKQGNVRRVLKAGYALDRAGYKLVNTLGPWPQDAKDQLRSAVDYYWSKLRGKASFDGKTKSVGNAKSKWWTDMEPDMDTFLVDGLLTRWVAGWSEDQAYNEAIALLEEQCSYSQGRVSRRAQGFVTFWLTRYTLSKAYQLDQAVWEAATEVRTSPGISAAADAKLVVATEDLYDKLNSHKVQWYKKYMGDVRDQWMPYTEDKVRTGAAKNAVWYWTMDKTLDQAVGKMRWQVAQERDALGLSDGAEGRRLLAPEHHTARVRTRSEPYLGAMSDLAAPLHRQMLTVTQEMKLYEFAADWDTTFEIWPTSSTECHNPAGKNTVLDTYNQRSNVLGDGMRRMTMIPSPLGNCLAEWDQGAHTGKSDVFGNTVLGYFLAPVPKV